MWSVRSAAFSVAVLVPFQIGHAQQASREVETLAGRPTPLAASAPTAVPALVPFSGVAATVDGKAVTGEAALTFMIYKEETGGEPLFTESQVAAFDSTGHYRVELGSTLPSGIPLDLFASGEARWLEVQVPGQKTGARILLVSVPYALKAGDASTLGGLPASAFALAGGKVLANAAAVAAAAISPDTSVSNVTTTGGTSGYLPVFTGNSTILDSVVFQSGSSIGIGDVPNTGAVLDVNGKSIWRGNVNLSRNGNATTSTGTNSFPFSFNTDAYNSSTRSYVAPVFYWEAEATGNNTASPGATMNLLYNKNSGTGAETGLYFNSNGTIHFASGQTFPGTGSGNGTITGVTAGTDLTGGGASGNVTLKLDTTKVPTLAGNNTFTGSNVFVPSLYEDTDVNIDNKNANTGNISPGLRLGQASGEGMSSERTSGGNQYGVDIYTGYQPRLSVNAAGQVAIGTGAAFDGSQLQVVSASAVGGEFLGGSSSDSSGDGLGASGIFATGGSSSGSSGSNAGAGITATGGNASGSTYYTFAGDGGDFQGGTAADPGCCYEGGPGGDSPAPLRFTGSGIVSVGGFAATGQPGYGAVLIGGGTNDGGSGAPGLYVISGTDTDGNLFDAATFNGNVNVDGTLNAEAKNFRIDHPADPANKYLVHSSIESSEMVNMYSGNVTTDELGLATVKLPDWFQVENGDFRYQLTVLGQFAQAIIKNKIAGNHFTIMTNASHVEVSWLVTGVRQDPYAKAHPLVVEQAKRGTERGLYLHPELYGQPKQRQTELGQHPEIMRRLQAARNARKTALDPSQTPAAKPLTASVSR
jgi:hypothetical protein